MNELEYLRSIKTFSSLVKYLRDELDWPIETHSFDDITFDYEPEDLGIDEKTSAKIKDIKQLRPIVTNQPWGIFFVNFEPKQLPVVVLRRILRALVIKKRFYANKSDISSWQLNDLLFISSYGEQSERAITFANFSENPDTRELPALKVLGWDDQDTVLHLDDVHKTLKDKLHWPNDDSDVNSWREQWSDAFTVKHREVITTSKQLAIRLAHLATIIKKRVKTILNVESNIGPFKMLMQAFKKVLIHDLEKDDFADMYAQTITYGLLAAKVHAPESIITKNLPNLVSNPFLKEMLGMFLQYGSKKGKIDFDETGIMNVVDFLNSPQINIDAILKDFGNKTQREDPVVHFYESFLTEYDKRKKIERGVFYTPQPIVSFIVRSVHEKLISDFGLVDGLASIATWNDLKRSKGFVIPEEVKPDDFFVTILEPAVGTGTFLVEVIDIIAKTMVEKWKKLGHDLSKIRNLWNDYVSEYLLPRLYGFELMMAPFVITDIKLTLKLSEISVSHGELFFRGDSKSKFNIFLTNSIEEPSQIADKKLDDMFSPLAHEASSVNEIKRHKYFTIILGNPPYSGESKNKGKWIMKLMEDYKKEPGGIMKLKERNPKWINADENKFIRFGQHLIEKNTCGILAFINPHGFVDNPTFRGMRWNMLKTFDEIYILNLHGNNNKKETSPDGSIDENVFDIQQGVSINFFSCFGNKQTNELGRVFQFELFGKRENKYDFLEKNSIKTIQYNSILNKAPMYFMVQKDFEVEELYNVGFSMKDLFPVSVLGFQTHRDSYAIDFNQIDTRYKINELRNKNITSKELYDKYGIKDNRDWHLEKQRSNLISDKNWENHITSCTYRPFDNRSCYLSYVTMDYPRREILNHIHNRLNLSLLISRQQAVAGFRHCFISNLPAESCALSTVSREGNQVLPLYIYPKNTNQVSIRQTSERTPNLNAKIINRVSNKLRLIFTNEKTLTSNTYSPIDMLDYIYAILHSPLYREKYKDFLKSDFPRVPYPKDKESFWQLVKLGNELRQIHLLESPVVEKFITKYPVKGNNEVKKVKYEEGKVFINPSQYFSNVPEIAWNFYIGGYQPAQKWLKDRKSRILSSDDIEHYQKIIVALTETDRIMKEIDKIEFL